MVTKGGLDPYLLKKKGSIEFHHVSRFLKKTASMAASCCGLSSYANVS